ncbi:MAG: porin family protein [Pyrinomonadaceae bacterium]
MKKLFCVPVMIFLISLTALAQDTPKVELYGGYSYVGGNFHGWNVSVAGNVNKWFGVVADVSGHRGGFDGFGVSERQRFNSFLVGPRFSLRKNKRVTPFVHALFGPTHVSVKVTENGETFRGSDTSFSMFLGGGVDIKVSDHVAIRAIQLEYGRANLFEESQSRGRVSVGVVFRFGKK